MNLGFFSSVAVLICLMGGLPHARACLELPRTIPLKHSPFPFKEFTITSGLFEFVTPDGMINTIHCQEEGGWNIDVKDGTNTSMIGWKDIQAVMNPKPRADGKKDVLLADSAESGNQTPLAFTDRVVSFTKVQGKAALTITCKVENNVMTMSVEARNEQGQVIGSASAAKMMKTRGLALEPVFDFSASKGQEYKFSSCGVSSETPQQKAISVPTSN